MDTHWRKYTYWAATTIAVLIVMVVVISYVSNASEGEPVIPLIPLLIAAAIWLMGWAFRD